MILNFHKSDNKIIQQIGINQITLPDNKLWQLGVTHFVCTFKTSLDYSGLYQVTSSLIQREDGNLHRTLFYVYLEKGTTHLDYSPNHHVKYKLRLNQIENAQFSVSRIKSGKIIDLIELAVSLEIRESNGWFQ